MLWSHQGENDFDQINVSGVPGGTNNQNGRFEFIDGRVGGSGLAVADAALGLFDRYAEIGTRAFTPYRSTSFEYFVQDSWRASDKLTLELGVRHLFTTPYFYSLWRNMAVFDPDSYDPSQAVVQDPATGNIISGDRFNGVAHSRRRLAGRGPRQGAHRRFGRVRPPVHRRQQLLGPVSKGQPPCPASVWPTASMRGPSSGPARAVSTPAPAWPTTSSWAATRRFSRWLRFRAATPINPGGASNVAFPQFFMTKDPVYKIPSAWNWNFTVQREIGFNTTVEVAYVGRVGQNMERTRELNALQPGTRPQSSSTPTTCGPTRVSPSSTWAKTRLAASTTGCRSR